MRPNSFRVLRRSTLLASLGALAAPCATAQFVCEPPPRVARVVFEPGASALVEAERRKLASMLEGATATSFIHVSIDPRTSFLEAQPWDRRSLADKRGKYIKEFLIRAGVDPAHIQLNLDFSLSHHRTEDHVDDRTAHLEVNVPDRPSGGECRTSIEVLPSPAR